MLDDDIDSWLDDLEGATDKFGKEVLGAYSGNTARAAEAERNRQFQADQSATAHQREVADLRAAGLNPILSATRGSGATTSAGSMAQQEGVIPSVSSAVEISRFKQELENLKQQENTAASQESLQDIQAHKTEQEAKLVTTTNQKVLEEIKLITEQTNSAKAFSGIQHNELFSSNIDRRINELKLESERRIVERYGSTAKGLLPFGRIFDKWKSPPSKTK